MKGNNLDNLEKEIISKHKEFKELDLENRRESIIQMRDARTKKSKRSVVILLPIGLLFLAGTVHFWYFIFNMSLLSNLGIISGLFLAALGIQYINNNRVKSYKKLFSDNFTDEDITTYFREEEKVNQQALDQLNRGGKYIIFFCIGIIILLINIEATEEFGIMLLFAGLSFFLISIVVFVTIFRPRA